MAHAHHGPGIIVCRTDYAGRRYPGPLVPMRSPAQGPGWYLYGHCSGPSADVICLVARPDVPPRKHPHYNNRVRRGWHTLREAREAAALINGPDAPSVGAPFREHGVWQCRGFDAWGRHFNRAFRTVREARGFMASMRAGSSRVARY